MTMRYFNDYNTFIDNSPWYYRLSRYFFEEQLFEQYSLKIPLPKNEAKYLAEKQNKLTVFAQKSSRFVRWLVGLDLLLDKITTLKNCAIENQIYHQQKCELEIELSALKMSKITTNFQQRIGFIGEHIIQQRHIIQEIPTKNSESYKNMPCLFERFGKGNEIIAAPHLNGGKPMTYVNLIAEKKETLKIQANARSRMIEKRKRVSYYNFYMDPGKKESDIIDGGQGVLSHINVELQKLRAEAPCVEIGEDLRLHVSYPFKSA